MRLIYALMAGAMVMGLSSQAVAADLCKGFGPQTPRDISSVSGSNARLFSTAPSSEKMNLCNIHFHTNAEHKGPGFSVFAGAGKHGGFQCNATSKLTAAELKDPTDGHGACHGVQAGGYHRGALGAHVLRCETGARALVRACLTSVSQPSVES